MIRRSYNRLVFKMGFAIKVRWVILNQPPCKTIAKSSWESISMISAERLSTAVVYVSHHNQARAALSWSSSILWSWWRLDLPPSWQSWPCVWTLSAKMCEPTLQSAECGQSGVNSENCVDVLVVVLLSGHFHRDGKINCLRFSLKGII